MRRALLTLVLLAAVAGCGDARDTNVPVDAVLDCAYPLAWDGITYDPGLALPSTFEVGPILGTGVVLGCGDASTGVIPDETVSVRSIEGVHPEVAVAALLEGAVEPNVWLAPGYLVENPGHPFHLAAAEALGAGQRPDDFTCGPPLETRVWAVSTPPGPTRWRFGPRIASSSPSSRTRAQGASCP